MPVRGVVGVDLGEAVEIYDYELEAFKLVHAEGLSIEEAALRVGASKATFWRALESCRVKLARALAEQRPFKITWSEKSDLNT